MKRYEQYKDSGVEWIGKIPENWSVSSIGRYTNLGRGRVISHLEIQENTGNFPVYSSQTENNGVMGFINTYDFEGEYVTWTTDGANAGTVSYRSGKFNCTNVCGTIQPRDEEQIDLRFLPYLLNLGTKFSVRLDINPKLMNNMMAKIPLVLPSKTEQTAIATFLDRKTAEIDQLIANKEKLIALYEEEKTAIINHAVTRGLDPDVKTKPSGVDWLGDIPEHWEVKRLKYVLKVNSGDGIKSDDINPFGAYPVYGGNGIMGYTDVFNSENDVIIIGRVGAKCGNVRLVGGKKYISDNALVANLINSYNFKYVSILMESLDLNKMANQNAQPLITGSMVKEKDCVFPPLTEQNAIVIHIEAECSRLDTIIEKFNKQIELFKEYRTTLISEVVTGKIDVRDEVPV